MTPEETLLLDELIQHFESMPEEVRAKFIVELSKRIDEDNDREFEEFVRKTEIDP